MSAVISNSVSLIRHFLDAIALLCGRLLLALVAIEFAIVLFRYAFSANYLWLQELSIYLHAAIFMCGGAATLLHNRHVRIDLLSALLGPVANRRIELLGIWMFLIPTMLVILWYCAPYVAQSWSVLEGSTELSGLPGLFLLKSLIPVFAVLMLLAGLVRLFASGSSEGQ